MSTDCFTVSDIGKVTRRKNSICVQFHTTFSYSPNFYLSMFIYLKKNLIILYTSVVCWLADFGSRVTKFTRLTGQTDYILSSGFNLLRRVYVGLTNMSFCERLSYKPINHISVLFTIVFMSLYDLTSYSIVLPMKISVLVSRLWSILFG